VADSVGVAVCSSSGVGVTVGVSSSGVGVAVVLGFGVAVGSSSSGVTEGDGVISLVGDGFGETKITFTSDSSGTGEIILPLLKTKTGRPIKKPTIKVPTTMVMICFFSIFVLLDLFDLLYHTPQNGCDAPGVLDGTSRSYQAFKFFGKFGLMEKSQG